MKNFDRTQYTGNNVELRNGIWQWNEEKKMYQQMMWNKTFQSWTIKI